MDAQDLEGSRRRPSDAVTPLDVSVCVWRPRRSPLLNLELANRYSRPLMLLMAAAICLMQCM